MVNDLRNKIPLWVGITGFSLVVAYFFWRVFFTPEPPVVVNTGAKWITSPPEINYCYFKKDIYVDFPVRQAWIVYQALDNITVYINRQEAFSQGSQGSVVRGISNVSKLLSSGKNTILVEAKSKGFEKRPEILIEIGYQDDLGEIHTFFTDDSWEVDVYSYKRKQLQLEAGSTYWLKAEVVEKPTSFLFSYDRDIYLLPFTAFFLKDEKTTLKFYAKDKLRYAWLRFNAPGNYQIYVNGHKVAEQEYANPLQAYDVKGVNVYRIDRFMTQGWNNIHFRFSPSYVGRTTIFLDAVAYQGGEPIKFSDGLRTSSSVIPSSSTKDKMAVLYVVDIPYTYKEYLSYGILFVILFILCLIISLSFKEQDRVFAYFLISFSLFAFFFSLNYDNRFFPEYFYRLNVVLLSLLLPFPIVMARSFAFDNPFSMNFNTHRVILFLITALGFLISFVHFNYETLHADEAALVLKAQGVFENFYPSIKLSENLPRWNITTSELLSYLQALFLKIFKEEETAIRMPGLLSGTIAILVVYKLAERLSNQRVAVLSAALFAFLPPMIGMTSFGRYPLLLLLMMLCCAYFLQLCFKKERRKYLILSAIFFLLGYFSWQGSAFFLLPVILNLIYVQREKFFKDTLLYLAIVLPVVATHLLYRFYLVSNFDVIVYGNSVASIAPTFGFIQAYFQPFYYFDNFFLANYNQFFFFLFCIGLGIQCYRLLTKQAFDRNLLFLQIYLLTTTFLMTFFLEVYSYRYSFYLQPYLIISACLVVERVSDLCVRYKGRCFLFLSLMLFLLSTDSFVKLTNFPHTIPQLKDHYDVIYYSRISNAVPNLRHYIAPNDIVINFQPHLLKVYHVEGVGKDLYLETRLLLPVITAPEEATPLHRVVGNSSLLTIEELMKTKGRNNKVWIIMAPFIMGSMNDEDLSYINNNFKLFYADINTRVLCSFEEGLGS